MKLAVRSKIDTSLKLIAVVPLGIALLVGAYLTLNTTSVSAANKKDWVTEDIISDANFTDKNSMSESAIQSFLDRQIGSCDMWGTGQAVEFGSSQTRAQFAKSRGWPAPPYVCLNKYFEVPKINPTKGNPVNNFNKTASKPSGSKSAAWIIKDAANRYNISPKVLLVKIATESAGPLTNDKWPLQSQYTYAMGSNCPDSGPGGSANCDNSYAGFSIQMYSAAALMRSYLDNMDQPWWSLKRPGKGVNGSNYVGWNVAPTGCGGTTLNIRNKATAALYTYTPYQPNDAALDNMYGTGNRCSAYGNRNFWRVYVDWFGGSRNPGEGSIVDYYNSMTPENQNRLGSSTSSAICTLKEGGCYMKFTRGAILWSKQTGARESFGAIRERWMQLGYENGSLGYPTGAVSCGLRDSGCYQRYQGGYIIGNPSTGYWESKGSIRDHWATMGYQESEIGYPTGPETSLPNRGWQQAYERGSIVGTYATGYWASKGSIREKWLEIGAESSQLGYPTSSERQVKPGVWHQNYQGGAVLGSRATGYWASKGSIRPLYVSLGEHNSELGLPLAAEQTDGDSVWQQQYQNGYIIGKKGVYFESRGPIRDYWQSLNGRSGKMGMITGAIKTGPTGAKWQEFEAGYIMMNPKDNSAWESMGSIRTQWAKLGYQTGKMGYPTGPERRAQDGTWSQTYENGIITSKRGVTSYTLTSPKP